VEVLGALFFFGTAWYALFSLREIQVSQLKRLFFKYRYIVEDKAKVDLAVAGQCRLY
jgi:hypothetical protein